MWRKLLIGGLLAIATIMYNRHRRANDEAKIKESSELTDRELLEGICSKLDGIKSELKHGEKTSRNQYTLGMGIAFLGIGLGVLVGQLGAERQAHDWRILVLVLLVAGVLAIYWAWVEQREHYIRNYAIIGSVMLFIAVPAWPLLAAMAPSVVIPDIITTVCGSLAVLLIVAGAILLLLAIFVAPNRSNKH